MQSYVVRRPGYQKVMNTWTSLSGKPYTNANPKPHAFDYLETSFSPTRTVFYVTVGKGSIVTTVETPGGVDTNGAIHSALDPVKANFIYLDHEVNQITDRAMEKVYEQLRGSSELIVDLAESRQTLELIRKALTLKKRVLKVAADLVLGDRRTKSTRLRDAFDRKWESTRRKKRRRPSGGKQVSRTSDQLSGQWLQYRYGIMPAIYSFYDAADNVRRHVYQNTFSVRGSSTRSLTENYSDVVLQPTPVTTSWQIVGKTRVTMNLNFRAPSAALQHAANWTSLNPASIAWELVPLSFVADWFVNVGDQLRAWENHVLFSQYFLGGTQSVYQREDRCGTYSEGPGGPIVECWPNGDYKTQNAGYRTTCSARSTKVSFSRTKISSLPRPAGLRVKVNLNASRVADAAALVRKNIGRLLKSI